MFCQPTEVTALAVVEFTRNLFKTLAQKYGGNVTLNELRVMNQIIYCNLHGRVCSVTDLHKVTGIPIPTVSRAVTHLLSDGWLSEQQDPEDGRRRIITLGPRSLTRTRREINEMVEWINEFRQHGLAA